MAAKHSPQNSPPVQAIQLVAEPHVAVDVSPDADNEARELQQFLDSATENELHVLRELLALPPVSNPDSDPTSLIEYLGRASDAGLDRLDLKFLFERAEERQRLVELFRFVAAHRQEPGRILLCKQLVGEFGERIGLAIARQYLIRWERLFRKSKASNGEPEEAPAPKKIRAVESVFKVEAEGDNGQGLHYREQHTSLLYYERYGCLHCHEKHGPHWSCGMCRNCYQMIRFRRKSIVEGRKVINRKPPTRIGVPTPLGLASGENDV